MSESSVKNDIFKAVNYLQASAAVDILKMDAYWPKWDSPWWQMLLLHEMALTHLIPDKVIPVFIEALNRLPIKIFPIQPKDYPPGLDPYRGSACHCQIGTVYQVLSKKGVDVDSELPWMRPWMLNYQMADGGYNCDNNAYLVTDEVPSSMVGLISIFEALLQNTSLPWTDKEEKVLTKGAQFLIQRRLVLGSESKYNSSERESAKSWGDLCFPRFYFYDILRGLNALVLWAETTNSPLPRSAIESVVQAMKSKFPEGDVRIGRRTFESSNTLYPDENNEWKNRRPARTFPLLDSVSQVGQTSEFLTNQWRDVQQRLSKIKIIE